MNQPEQNALTSSQVKLLVNRGADLDERALMDGQAELVRGGRIDENAVRWMQTAPLASYVPAYQQMKLSAIKEESGQNQISRGEAAGGITAASAILAMQEAGSKRSRLLIEQLYDGFEQLVRMIVDVIQENYTEQRVFRLENQQNEQLFYGGEQMMDFDITIQVQKQTAYTTLYQNELALQLLGAGLIDRASALELMSFVGKEQVQARMQRQFEAAEQAAREALREGDGKGGEKR